MTALSESHLHGLPLPGDQPEREPELWETHDVAASAVKPTWMRWFCASDDLFWDGSERDCWFCGHPGIVASAPRLTSQQGFGPELVA